jgi:DNA-binding MarR family transcriptional regulator
MFEEGPPRPSDPERSIVGEREALVLEQLGQSDRAQVAFQGLRRKLDLHQEILSRTLRRLERDGLVRKDDGGYALTEEGLVVLRALHPAAQSSIPARIVEALLPPHLDSEAVAAHLSRRWFRGLRWYGRSDSGGEIVLTWLSEPGNDAVRLRIGSRSLSLEADSGAGDASFAFASARAILAAIAEIYGPPPGLGNGIATFAAGAGRMAG